MIPMNAPCAAPTPKRLPWKTRSFRCTLTALSPLHIGATAPEPACRYAFEENGTTAASNRVFFLREETFLSRLGAMSAAEYHRKPFPAEKLPEEEALRRGTLYELRATKAARSLNKEVRPFIRNGFGRAYIPGTSLKGALRGALLFSHLLCNEKLRKELRRTANLLVEMMRNASPTNIGRIRKEKGHAPHLEALFRSDGSSPHSDLAKAFKVGDSTPFGEPLFLAAVNIFTAKDENGTRRLVPLTDQKGGKAAPLFCEVLPPGATLEFDLDIDVPLAEHLGAERRRKGTASAIEAVKDKEDLLLALQDTAQFLLPLEKAFLDAAHASSLWKSDFEEEQDDAAIIRLGWGCGWMGHSLFPLLAYDEEDTPKSPASRKCLTASDGTPQELLGWARLRFSERP